MALIFLFFVVIVFSISYSIFYFLLWLIYRKVFESQEQISIALTFVVSIGLVMLFVYPPMVFFIFYSLLFHTLYGGLYIENSLNHKSIYLNFL